MIWCGRRQSDESVFSDPDGGARLQAARKRPDRYRACGAPGTHGRGTVNLILCRRSSQTHARRDGLGLVWRECVEGFYAAGLGGAAVLERLESEIVTQRRLGCQPLRAAAQARDRASVTLTPLVPDHTM